jgi:hypothetical protein
MRVRRVGMADVAATIVRASSSSARSRAGSLSSASRPDPEVARNHHVASDIRVVECGRPYSKNSMRVCSALGDLVVASQLGRIGGRQPAAVPDGDQREALRASPVPATEKMMIRLTSSRLPFSAALKSYRSGRGGDAAARMALTPSHQRSLVAASGPIASPPIVRPMVG